MWTPRTAIVGSADFRAAGEAAQRASITLLTNADGGCRRVPPCCRCAAACASTSRASTPRSPPRTARSSTTPAEADVAILRLQAPFEQRGDDVRELLPRRFARLPRRGDRARRARSPRTVPTVVDVFLDRPAILDADRRGGRRRRRELGRERRGAAGRAHRSCRAAGQAAVRPAASMAAVEASPSRRAVRHRRSAVPVRPRPHPVAEPTRGRPPASMRPPLGLTPLSSVKVRGHLCADRDFAVNASAQLRVSPRREGADVLDLEQERPCRGIPHARLVRQVVHVEHELHRVVDRLRQRSSPSARR